MKQAILMLEDGTCFEGISAGAHGESYGEIVFNTSMMGYQEILTDPSYRGQIVTMTYPEIGNYGVVVDDAESKEVQAAGFVMKEISKINSNWRSGETLAGYLKKHRIVAIEGIDTRALTRHIRDFGAMRSVLSDADPDKRSLLKKVRQSRSIVGIDLAKEVSTRKPYRWTEKLKPVGMMTCEADYVCVGKNKKRFKVVAYDCGIKHNILRILADLNCDVVVVPIETTAEQVLKYRPDGVFVSNGPGDPSAVPYIVEELKKLLGVKPIFGICFGHQLLGQALGGKTYKLKFGHRGANHPVMDLATRKIDITVQNHGFAVDVRSFRRSKYKVVFTHTNLNDKTNEGLEVKSLKVFSIQHHPEASAGPHDARYIFNKFIDNMKSKFD